MKAPEQYVKSVQNWQQRHQNDVSDVGRVFFVSFKQISHIILRNFGISIVDFEQVNDSWDKPGI